MYILFAKVLKPIQEDNNKKLNKTKSEVNKRMKCPDCNLEMKLVKESGYMKQYRCDVCGRVETLWTVCVTA
jgi:transposase-like protein